MKPIVFEPRPDVATVLEDYLSENVRSALRLPSADEPVKTSLAFDEWRATEEGRVHLALMTAYVLPIPNINAKTANRIQRNLQSKGRESRGRPKTYDPQFHDLKIQRTLRLFFLNKLIADALKIPTGHWNIPVQVTYLQPDVLESKPEDMFDMLVRFEAWTEFKLPSIAWLLYTKKDRQAMATRHPGAEMANDGGVSLNSFASLRTKEREEAIAVAQANAAILATSSASQWRAVA